jgi:hypothetical protein
MVTIPTNYVQLKPAVPKRMLLDRWEFDERTITDPKSKLTKKATAMVFHCILEDGVAVDKPFSTLSTKLMESLKPHIETGDLFHRMVEIVWYPAGHATEYSVRLL